MSTFKLPWGGLIGSLPDETGDTEYISLLRKKLKAVEESKNELEFIAAVNKFDDNDKNYLNSPVLDNLTGNFLLPNNPFSIFRECLQRCLNNKDFITFDFLIGIKTCDMDFSLIVEFLCQTGNLDSVKYFIENYYPLTRKGYIEFACFGGNLELVIYLLEKGIPIHDFIVCYENAMRTGSLNIVQFLETKFNRYDIIDLRPKFITWLSCFCDYSEYKMYFYTYFKLAVYSGNVELAKYVYSRSTIKNPSQELMLAAAVRSNVDMFEYLKSLGLTVQNDVMAVAVLNNKNKDVIKYLTNQL